MSIVVKEKLARKPKDTPMNAAEKMLVAQFYKEHQEVLEGSFEGASKRNDSNKKKAYEELAALLTQLGHRVCTKERAEAKISDMKKRARTAITQTVCF